MDKSSGEIDSKAYIMKETREEFVLTRYKNQLDWYSQKANLYKKITRIMSVIAVVMSLLLPVTTSVFPYEWKFRWISLTLSLGIGLVTSLESVFRWRELWISYRATEEALKREYSFYVVRAGIYEDVEDPIAQFIVRIETILLNEHSKWIFSEKSEKMSIRSVSKNLTES